MPRLPQSVKVCLWSYDNDKISLTSAEDRSRIILNILNRGTRKAVDWLWRNFNEAEIRSAIRNSLASEWNRKSLSFWSMIYRTSPSRKNRFVKSYGTTLEYSR